MSMFKRRVLSFFLALVVLLVSLLGVLPVRAGAVVPVGLVESALASYSVSAGYSWYSSDSGDAMIASISNLYNTFYNAVSQDFQNLLTLAEIASGTNLPSGSRGYVYLDNSGQMVITKAAVDMFQQFCDWVQSEYSIPDYSDSPVSVVSSDFRFVSNASFSFVSVYCDSLVTYGNKSFYVYPVSLGLNYLGGDTYISTGTVPGWTSYFCLVRGGQYYTSWSVNPSIDSTDLGFLWLRSGNSYVSNNVLSLEPGEKQSSAAPMVSSSVSIDWLPIATSSASDFDSLDVSTLVSSSSVSSLAASIGSQVIDLAEQASDDDAVVIGVGAGIGSTAQDIVDIVGQGIKAQTLDPSVSITAEAVIDTPVQPYPDIDGLGLPSLGAALVSRFPFCIPWDFVDTLRLVAVDPRPPVFDVDLVPQSFKSRIGMTGDTTFHVDLSGPQYAKVFLAIRWATLVSFCLGLALLTKRLIWTA